MGWEEKKYQPSQQHTINPCSLSQNGRRESGATAFLEKALKRKNVTVRTGAMIRQIDFASTSAVGVTYNIVNDDTNTPFSPSLAPNGEVILTGEYVEKEFKRGQTSGERSDDQNISSSLTI